MPPPRLSPPRGGGRLRRQNSIPATRPFLAEELCLGAREACSGCGSRARRGRRTGLQPPAAVSAPRPSPPTAASLPGLAAALAPAAAAPPPPSAPSARRGPDQPGGRGAGPRPGGRGLPPGRHVPRRLRPLQAAGLQQLHEGVCGCPLTALACFPKAGCKE